MMKLTKTLDVSELTDAQVSKLEKIVNLHPTVIERLMGPEADRLEAVQKQCDELKRVMRKLVNALSCGDYGIYGRITHAEMAQGIQKVISDAGIDLNDDPIKSKDERPR